VSPRVAVVVGNPKPRSRTHAAAVHLATEIAGSAPALVVDLADLGAGLLDWSDTSVDVVLSEVRAADLVVVASPTYKATYTGLLKLFLDRFPPAGLRQVVAVPLMLGASPAHALAPELTLRPVLTELGAIVPVPGAYVLDGSYDDPAAYADWLVAARPVLASLLPEGAAA
jgi:FMN reductase